MKKILLTGFGSFEGFAANPSGEIALALDGYATASFTIAGRRIDVSWRRAHGQLVRAVEETTPAMLIALGVAGEAKTIRLEQLAKNAGTRRADVDGFHPELGERLEIVSGAPPAYFATLPPIAPPGTERSSDAGEYLCNYLFYRAMHTFSAQIPAIGFIHVPPDAAKASVLELIERIVEASTS